jgi:transcriptional regulator with XRE-family HTH domain
VSVPRNGNPIGPVGLAVAAKIRMLRRKRGITTNSLSELLLAAGRPIHSSAITKIEQGDRRIDIDDLAAIATALGTTATSLLEPPEACSTCHGKPKPGFACLACGTEAQR